MSRIWAIEFGSTYFIRHTEDHPSVCGHEDECVGRKVVELDREPLYGERINFTTASIEFDVSLISQGLVIDLKQEAARRIESVAPLWRQINDMSDDSVEAEARKAFVLAVRHWSNDLEKEIAGISSRKELIEFNNKMWTGGPLTL